MFEEMKAWLATDEVEDYQFSYDDPYADYVNGIFGDAETELAKEVDDDSLFIEASIQGGMGGDFMTCNRGTTHWDFEWECECLLEYAQDAETEDEFKELIKRFLRARYNECEPEDDDDDDDVWGYEDDGDEENMPDSEPAPDDECNPDK